MPQLPHLPPALALITALSPLSPPRLQFFVVLTSQRELFPRLTADMRRFRKPPRLPPEPEAPGSSASSPGEASGLTLASGAAPLFPPLAAEVGMARARLSQLVRLAGGHCRRDTLWKRLFLLEPPGPDRLRLGGRLALAELEELLEAVHAKSIGDIDPQLVRPGTSTQGWGGCQHSTAASVEGTGVSMGTATAHSGLCILPGLLPVHDGLLVPEPDQGSLKPLPPELSPFPESRLGNSVPGKSP